MAKDVTDSSFKADVLDSGIPVLVDFWAPWCGPCKVIGPVLEELATENADKVKIVKLNVDDNQVSAMTYQVRSIPTLIMFKNGQPVDQLIGAFPKPQLQAFINKHI